jgi:hypothetical protein
MAPRGKAAAAAAEPEVDEADVEEERDYSVYAEKELTPKMLDFAEWVGENVGDITEMEPERLIALGPTLYHDFQRSDFNKSRTEERRAARVTAAEEKATAKAAKEEPEAAPAKPAGRGRAAGRATPAKAAATRPAAATPPKRRGRPAASAAKEAAY